MTNSHLIFICLIIGLIDLQDSNLAYYI